MAYDYTDPELRPTKAELDRDEVDYIFTPWSEADRNADFGDLLGEPDDDETLGPCGCTDYHMADCPLMTGTPEPDSNDYYRDDDR